MGVKPVEITVVEQVAFVDDADAFRDFFGDVERMRLHEDRYTKAGLLLHKLDRRADILRIESDPRLVDDDYLRRMEETTTKASRCRMPWE